MHKTPIMVKDLLVSLAKIVDLFIAVYSSALAWLCRNKVDFDANLLNTFQIKVHNIYVFVACLLVYLLVATMFPFIQPLSITLL